MNRKLQTVISLLFIFLVIGFCTVHAVAEQSVKLTLKTEKNHLDINAVIPDVPQDASRVTLVPNAAQNYTKILQAFFPDSMDQLTDVSDEYYLRSAIISSSPMPGKSSYLCDLTVFRNDQHLIYDDTEHDMSGDCVDTVDSRFASITREEARIYAEEFLKQLDLDVKLAKAETCENSKAQKGYYHFIFIPQYNSLPIYEGTTNIVAYPQIFVDIGDNGIFSLNGKFLFDAEKETTTIVPIDEIIKQINQKLDLLINGKEFLPITKIELMNYSNPVDNGSFEYRPVWVLSTDKDSIAENVYGSNVYIPEFVFDAETGMLISY